jgi:hypothetical protein
MQGRAAGILVVGLLVGLAFAGCDEGRLTCYFDDEEPSTTPVAVGAKFDAATAGAIAGRVTWAGARPSVPPYSAPVSPLSELPPGPRLDWPNPHAPKIDPANRGIAGAVVFLRRVDAARARPWDHAPVRIVVQDCQYHIFQDACDAATGFVHTGDAVVVVSEEDRFHAVQARGAAFFTLTLPDRGRPHARVLPHSGIVELSSNAGQFWMRGHLFVSDHPYFCRTAADGRFALEQVPPDSYELACWLPDWHEASHERDGETTFISRLTFRPAVVKLRDITIGPGERKTTDFTYGPGDFPP